MDLRNGARGDGAWARFKADVNQADGIGCTALHWAAIQGNLDACKKLLDMGVDPYVRDQKGETPVEASVGKPNGARVAYLFKVFSLQRGFWSKVRRRHRRPTAWRDGALTRGGGGRGVHT